VPGFWKNCAGGLARSGASADRLDYIERLLKDYLRAAFAVVADACGDPVLGKVVSIENRRLLVPRFRGA